LGTRPEYARIAARLLKRCGSPMQAQTFCKQESNAWLQVPEQGHRPIPDRPRERPLRSQESPKRSSRNPRSPARHRLRLNVVPPL
jgi:hypothetical protein